MRNILVALALAAGPLAAMPAVAQTAPAAPGAAAAVTPMAPGARMRTNAPLGERVVREVMFTSNGGGVILMYDMPTGAPQSRRVVRLENVNGMLEVIYDTEMSNMPLASGGTPRLVQQGAGYMVEYGR
jgi:hypothetical protein